MSQAQEQPRNPLHGVTLERMLTELVAEYGWETLGKRIRIKCFTNDPSIGSSLAFLRKTPWARQKVEDLYISLLRIQSRSAKRKLTSTPGAKSMTEPRAEASE